jgi:hypothetical protein
MDYANGTTLDFDKPLMNAEHAAEVQQRIENLKAAGTAQEEKKDDETVPF